LPDANLKNVIVSGASRGLGLGIARKLAADGYRVIAVARRESPELTAAMAEAAPGEIHFRAFDLNTINAIPGLVREIKTAFGPIYGLVNNAGLGTEGLLSTMKQSQIEDLVRLNTIAPIILAQHAVRAMMTAGQGRVINMASIMASTGYSGLSVYGATKASMVGFTKSLAREVGKLGITVNAVAPGFIATEMTAGLDDDARAKVAGRSALKRLAEIEDVAAAVAYLMGETGRNITGTVMTVDAGGTA
jgi:3-oxoacyl-[acyl-carrier protein] reductase